MTEMINEDGLITCSPGLQRCAIIVCPSVNEEIFFAGQVPLSSNKLLIRKKNIVRSILPFSVEVGKQVFEITFPAGQKLLLTADRVERIVAGSSVNCAFVLLALGIADIGLIAAIGTGKTGRSLTEAMRQKGLEYLLCRREGTSISLSVQDPHGNSIVFCEKPPYQLSEEVSKHFKNIKPKILMATSVRPVDLKLVEILTEKAEIRVLIPHADLINDKSSRSRLMSLTANCHLLQMNESEASLLLEEPFSLEKMGRIAEFGAEISIVTLGAQGAVMMEKGKKPVWQEGFPVEAKYTTGAGDVYCASFVYYHWLRGKRPPIEVCFRMANWVAAQKVQFVGPWNGIPSRAERKTKLLEWWPDYPR